MPDTTFLDLIKRHPIIISPFHPSNCYQTIAGLMASAMVGLKILIISDNKSEIDRAVGQAISNDNICTYDIFKKLPTVPDSIIIIDSIVTFQKYELIKLFTDRNNNLIFIADLNLQSDNYKYLTEFFPVVKKINLSLLNNFPVLKIQRFHFNISEDLYNKYKNSDDKIWYNLCFYEADRVSNFNTEISSKVRALLTKIILNQNSRHLVYISADISQGLQNFRTLLNKFKIPNYILNETNSFNNNNFELNKNFKGVILTSKSPTKNNDINNIHEIHFIGNIDYIKCSDWIKSLHQIRNYSQLIPELIINFYLSSIPEDGHISQEDHQFHLIEREFQNSQEIFFPTSQRITLCWRNNTKFCCWISD